MAKGGGSGGKARGALTKASLKGVPAKRAVAKGAAAKVKDPRVKAKDTRVRVKDPGMKDAGAPTASPVPPMPPGQRLYDLPYSGVAPRLINPDVGLHNLVARAGHNAAYAIDVTLLDAPDHRLVRSGVLLAHRVLDGRGEWYLSAPDWEPLLPSDRIEPMGHADLPEEFADLLRPLRRRGTLGPVAALSCDRREFALRDDTGTTLALLRDDKVTVRRGGLTTARYREVMITPVGPGLTGEQSAWLDRALLAAGATAVPRFPRLVARLGAPATGPTDFPQPEPFDPAGSFRRFVGQLLALRLRAIVEADLAVRGGDRTALARLSGEAARLQDELRGLSAVLDGEWLEDLHDELGWISVNPAPGDRGRTAPEALLPRLRSERYLTRLERLVGAAGAPRLAGPDLEPAQPQRKPQTAQEVLTGLVTQSTARLVHAADGLTEDSPVELWEEASRSVAQLQAVTDVAGRVLAGAGLIDPERVAKAGRQLAAVQQLRLDPADPLEQTAGLTGPEAFAAGRAYEQRLAQAARARRHFVRSWAKTRKSLS